MGLGSFSVWQIARIMQKEKVFLCKPRAAWNEVGLICAGMNNVFGVVWYVVWCGVVWCVCGEGGGGGRRGERRLSLVVCCCCTFGFLSEGHGDSCRLLARL